MKRFMSFLLAIILILGLVPSNTAFAAQDDVKVRIRDGGHWNFEGLDGSNVIKVTFNNNGFQTVLKIDGQEETVTNTCKGNSLYTSTKNNKITLRTDVSTISNNRYVQLKYSIKNNDTVPHTISIATHADVQIASKDNAAITYNATTHALEMSGDGYTFKIFVSDTYGVSDVDTYWVGQYSKRTNHLWDTTKVGSCTGIDSGITFGWLNRTVQPGETLSLANAGGVGGLNTPPKITSCNIVDKKDFYWPGDEVKFSANISDAEKDPLTVKWVLDSGADESATIVGTYNSPYPTVTSSLILPSITQGMTVGNHTLKIVVIDKVGDSAAYSVPFTVYSDTTSPTIDSLSLTTTEWAQTKGIVVKATDGPVDVNKRSGIKSLTLKKDNVIIGTYNVPAASNKNQVTYTFNNLTSNGTYVIEAEDNFGNKSSKNIDINRIDRNPPEANLNVSEVQNIWQKEIAIPSGTYTDSQSGISKIEYFVNNKLINTETVENLESYNSEKLALSNLVNGKNNTLLTKTYDKAGNITKNSYDNFWFDSESPTITSTKENSNGKYVYEDTISITASDQYSGINKFYYAITNSEECPTPDLTTGIGEVKNSYTRENLKITTPGTNYVHIWTEDLVGNQYNKHFGPFYIDRVGPSIKVDKTSSAWSDSFTITALSEAHETSKSGIKAIKYKIIKTESETAPVDKPTVDDDFIVINTNGTPSTFSTPINIPDETGIYYVYLLSENNAGVKSSIIERGPYKIDKDYPTITSSIEKQEQYKNSIPITATLQDQTSHISYTYKITDSNEIPEFPEYIEANNTQYIGNINISERVDTTGIYYLHIKVKDIAGHETVRCFGPFYVDLDNPLISINKEKQESWSNEKNGLELIVNMEDATSDIDKYGYKITDTEDIPEFDINKSGDIANIKITENGVKYLHFAAKDTAGNITRKIYGPYWFDNTEPQVSTEITETNEYTSSIDLLFKLKDNTSGLKSWEYAVTNFADDNPQYTPGPKIQDGHTEINGNIIYNTDNAINNETEGAKAVYIKVVDMAGNVHIEKFGPYMVDTSKPIIEDELKENIEYIRYVVNLNLSDIGSGIIKYGYSIDMNPTTDIVTLDTEIDDKNEVSVPVIIRKMEQNATGKYYIHTQCEDAMGLRSKIYTFGPYIIDNTLPSVSITAPDKWQKEDVNVLMTATDNMFIKESKYSITKNEENYIEDNLEIDNDRKHSKNITLNEDGIYEILLESKDGGDNTKTTVKTVKLDKTAPVIYDDWYNVYVDSKEISNKDQVEDHIHIKDIAYIKVEAIDETLGISKFTYKVMNKDNPEIKDGTILTKDGETTYYFMLHTSIDGEIKPEDYIEVTFYDQAGNSTSAEIHDIVMDDVPPTINYGERGLPDWINSTTKKSLQEFEGKENIDVDIYVADNMTLLGTAWETKVLEDEDIDWNELPTQENPDNNGIDEDAIETGIIENSKIYIDPDAYTDGYYRIYVKAWDHTFNKNVNHLDFKVDKTSPVFNVTEVDNKWHNTPITLDINIIDNLSGLSTVELYTADTPDKDTEKIYEKFDVEKDGLDTSYVLDIDGEYDIFITAVDIAGNEKTITRHIKLDQQTEWEAPSVEFFNEENMSSQYVPGEWSNTSVMAKYKYSDIDLPVSGLKNYTHGVNNDVYDIENDTEIFDIDGIYTFRTSSTSNAGLISKVSPDNVDIDNEKEGYEIKIDKTLPMVEKILIDDDKPLENNMYFNHDIDLYIYAKDNLSGVEKYFYKLDTNDDYIELENNVAHISADEEYSGNISFKVIDNANNESYSMVIENFNIDTTKPVLSYKECVGNDIVLQSTEPITKYINGYFRFNDKETGKFIKTIYMNNNRIRVKNDLIYINVSGIVVPGDYSLTIDPNIFFDRAGNMNEECTLNAIISSGETPEFIGATATLADGYVINATINRDGAGYHITLPTNTEKFILKPIYSNSELTGIITSSYGEFKEDGTIEIEVKNIVDGVVDVKMGDKVENIKIVMLNYSINTDIGEGIKASTDMSKLEESIDIYDVINNAVSEITLTLSIKKADEENENIKKDIELAKTIELNQNQAMSYPIDISIIQNINGQETKLRHLQSDIPITIEIPQELRDRQWYKVIRIHDGDADVLEAEKNGNDITFDSYRFSTYFILAGPRNYHSSSTSSSSIHNYVKNWNFVVPYYGEDINNIEPMSVTTSTINSTYIRYIGKDKVKAIYNPREFFDVPEDHWAKNSIDFLAARRIFNGTPGNMFEGQREMTRAEAITILVRLTSGIELSHENYFTDVKNDTWYAPYINTAYEMGITKGVGNNKFNPEGFVTRQEFATMIYRYMGSPEIRRNQNLKYKDSNKVDDWALNAVIYMTTNNILQGNDKNQVIPRNCITRYEAAELLAKAIRHMVAEKYQSTYKITNKKLIENYDG